MRILGVDPGSRLTGYGCVDATGSQLRLVAHGTLKLIPAARTISPKADPGKTPGERKEPPLEDRLLALFQGLSSVIQEYRPHVMAIEKVFFAKNAVSALKLGQARGVAILTGRVHSLQIAEYSATEVKKVVAGFGRADKEQVMRMVQILTGQRQFATYDASDGVALAICHYFLSSRGPLNDRVLKW